MDIVFLTGHRKSGTTMLHRLFDGHPDALVYPCDLAFLYAYFPCFSARKDDSSKLRQRLAGVLRSSLRPYDGASPTDGATPLDVERFTREVMDGLSDDQLLRRSEVTQAVLLAFVRQTGTSQKAVLVVKETSQTIFADRIDPEQGMRMLQIIRDPRDTYAAISAGVENYYSQLGEDRLQSLASVINRARMDMLIASRRTASGSTGFHATRFEDLVQTPEETMRRLAEWVAIDFHPSLLSPTRFGEGFTGNSHDGDTFRGISAKNLGRWSERITESEVGVIEFWLRDVMGDWDYQNSLDPDAAAAYFADFYEWYNCQYFYVDSFADKVPG